MADRQSSPSRGKGAVNRHVCRTGTLSLSTNEPKHRNAISALLANEAVALNKPAVVVAHTTAPSRGPGTY